MNRFKAIASRLWKEDDGQDLVEYALLLVLIALAAVVAIRPLGTAIESIFTNAASNLTIQGAGTTGS